MYANPPKSLWPAPSTLMKENGFWHLLYNYSEWLTPIMVSLVPWNMSTGAVTLQIKASFSNLSYFEVNEFLLSITLPKDARGACKMTPDNPN